MQKEMELIADIDRAQVEYGQCGLWWLAQHSFIAKLGKTIIYLDVFLSPHEDRQIPAMLKPEQIRHADYFLGTHDHLDHIDREVWPALAQASPQALFVVPDLLRESLAEDLNIPLERFVGLDDGTRFETENVRITGVASAHEFLDPDPQTGQHPYMGYVVEANGFTLYHPGDTCRYEGIEAKLRSWKFDLMLLPINGRDAKRLASGCIGNMTYQEAADLAGALEPGLTIPAHYDMFKNNSEDPHLFTEYMKVKYPHLKTHVCDYGQRLIVG